MSCCSKVDIPRHCGSGLPTVPFEVVVNIEDERWADPRTQDSKTSLDFDTFGVVVALAPDDRRI